jgi:glutamate dehydrogenase
MQAQMVKNAVIVPEGAKGGFILKRPMEGQPREVVMNEGIECYRILVRGMLDVTDNLRGDKVIHPEDVVRHDENDPYLVVAADKGTATFSDIANAISMEYEFWLGDAFASGGSAGYDHKEVGITARGAWECIKRHFRELGTDIQTQEFDVIGVGDMAGDVFGNGMLLSKKIRLVGAFNHQHIFCDPNPDPEKTWKERDRLFKAVKAWGDYDQKLLSKGGKIYSRSEKSLTLTKEIRDRFGIDAEKVAPGDLMHAMLKSQCDLLYFGGIGTYIKSVTQTHIDVGDRANDAIRVDGPQVNAKVVGEGANLAVTRRARVEMGLKGIKLNADFIDNSGGVDCSDHEVNIKILLQELTSGVKPVMTIKARNQLLEAMTDEVAALVLRDNYQQSQAISMVAMDAPDMLSTHARFIDQLEQKFKIKRSVEGLPTQAEIEERKVNHQGLTRSELATLISLAKIRVTKALLESDLPDDPLAEDWLMHYFPVPLRTKYPKAIKTHRLRREIIAAQMTASIVNRLGPTFMMVVADKTGADFDDIARACFLVREAFKLRPLWYALEKMDSVISAQTQMRAMKQIVKLIEQQTLWFLTHDTALLRKGNLAKASQDLSTCIHVILSNLDKALPPARRQRIDQFVAGAVADGLPEHMAVILGHLGPMRSALDICRISDGDKKQIPDTAAVFFHLGEDLHFDWLRNSARMLVGSSFWQAEAIDGVMGQLYATQAALTGRILKETDKKRDAIARFAAWKEANAETLRALDVTFADMKRVPQLDLAMITLAEQRLRQIAG